MTGREDADPECVRRLWARCMFGSSSHRFSVFRSIEM